MLTPCQFLKVFRDNGYGGLNAAKYLLLSHVYEHGSITSYEAANILICRGDKAADQLKAINERGLGLLKEAGSRPHNYPYIRMGKLVQTSRHYTSYCFNEDIYQMLIKEEKRYV